MTGKEDADLVGRSLSLSERERAVGGPTGIIDSLVRGAKRQRQILTWVVVSVVLSLVLLILLGFAYLHINANAVTAKKTCQADNEFRRNDRAVWTSVLGIPTQPTKNNPGLTLGQLLGTANVAKLDKVLNLAFAPRICK